MQSAPGSPSYLRHVSGFFGAGKLGEMRDHFAERELADWTPDGERGRDR